MVTEVKGLLVHVAREMPYSKNGSRMINFRGGRSGLGGINRGCGGFVPVIWRQTDELQTWTEQHLLWV